MFTSTVEAAHARREFLEQAGVSTVIRHALDHGVLRWSLQIARVGATEHVIIPHAGAVLTGDTVVTGHPTSKRLGPQLLPAWFDHDHSGMESAVGTLSRLDTDLLLPGHGEPWRGGLTDVSAR